MFRIWGGGIYQKDSLYDMADEMGIMVTKDSQLIRFGKSLCLHVPESQLTRHF